jgi:hypothetical protein
VPWAKRGSHFTVLFEQLVISANRRGLTSLSSQKSVGVVVPCRREVGWEVAALRCFPAKLRSQFSGCEVVAPLRLSRCSSSWSFMLVFVLCFIWSTRLWPKVLVDWAQPRIGFGIVYYGNGGDKVAR